MSLLTDTYGAPPELPGLEGNNGMQSPHNPDRIYSLIPHGPTVREGNPASQELPDAPNRSKISEPLL